MACSLTLPTLVFPSHVARGAPVDCSRGTNLGFETPLVRDAPMGPPPNWALFDESLVPGWDTSASDNLIELWESTFLGVPSYAGGQHAELNATQSSALSQDFPTLEGDSIDWTVAHRARTLIVESADVRFGAPGAPLVQQLMNSPQGSWTVYTGTYVVPAGQPTTRMSFVSNNPGSLGNFLDGINLELECDISVIAGFTGFSDVDGSGHTNPGDLAGFEYLVTNLGSATVESLTVSDGLGFSASCPVTTLMPGESTTCTGIHVLTTADVDGGSVTSQPTAGASDAAGVTVEATDTLTVEIDSNPSIALVKIGGLDDTVVAPSGRVDAADVIEYTFEVTNTGNVTLDSIGVTDPAVAGVICPATSLASGAMMACSATFTLTQSEVDAGWMSNTATVEGSHEGTSVMATAVASVVLPAEPGITISKLATVDDGVVAPVGRVDAGDTIDYELTVANTGNVTLDHISIDDSLVSVDCPATTLAPDATMLCTSVLTLEQDDIDSGLVENTATVFGNPPLGDPGDSGDDATASASVVVDLANAPAIGIAKSLESAEVSPDGMIVLSFRYTVETFGNVTIGGLVITDDVEGLFKGLSPSGYTTVDGSLEGSQLWTGTTDSNILADGQSLAPGETGDVLAVFTITGRFETTIANIAGVSGLTPDDSPVEDQSVDGTDPDPDSDDDPTDDQSPTVVEVPGLYALGIAKSGTVVDGETGISWTVSVANDGPATAPGPITVIDTPGPGLVLTGASGAGWVCSVTTSLATCVRDDDLEIGETATIIVTSDAEEGAATVANTALVVASNDGQIGYNTQVTASLLVGDLPFTGSDAQRLVLMVIFLLVLGVALVRSSQGIPHRSS